MEPVRTGDVLLELEGGRGEGLVGRRGTSWAGIRSDPKCCYLVHRYRVECNRV